MLLALEAVSPTDPACEGVTKLVPMRVEPTNWSGEAMMRACCYACLSRKRAAESGGWRIGEGINPIRALIACDPKEVWEALLSIGIQVESFLQRSVSRCHAGWGSFTDLSSFASVSPFFQSTPRTGCSNFVRDVLEVSITLNTFQMRLGS